MFLVVLQVSLIAKLLPHDFRFLGGLQYGLLAAGAVALRPLLRARDRFKWVAGALLLLLGPWLAAELYYARPFVTFAFGRTTRQDFLRRYVAFTVDFQALDKVLPRDAKLYVPESRMPADYAPRPVIFTLADWERRTPLYRLLEEPFGEPFDVSVLEPQTGLTCGKVVYRNPDAIVLAYRTPNQEPERAAVVVQRCVAESSGRETLP
jgi:hypothetical protein